MGVENPFDTSAYHYTLPKSMIAQTPAEPRDSSRLMVVDRNSGTIMHRTFREIACYLQGTDLLVLNDTRVVKARLHAVKPGGGARVEVFLLRPLEGERS
ncbi:MAG: S-adenosylmethionine:tRNA ribosyltransferase-isomerase, partial [Thermovirgaceae bacterium]